MPLSLKPRTSWHEVYTRSCAVAPESFEGDRILNLLGGEWQRIGRPGDHVTPVDGSRIPGPSRVDHDQAVAAVSLASDEHKAWGAVGLDERKARVKAAVDEMRRHRETLAILLVWEIGKPWRLACADVDRALDGADWYLGEIERQLDGRAPLPGPISNIASWNYPMSVQVHSELVQALAGNAVVAKTPSQGCCHTLTVAHAIMRRQRLPVTLLSGAYQSWATRSSAAPGSARSPLSAGAPTAARPQPPWLIPASGISWSRRVSTPGVSGTSATGTTWRRI
jgi:delta 1-pyrroline-5-carboxylate dehydrogenase